MSDRRVVRRRRLRAAVLVGVVVLALSACNPLTVGSDVTYPWVRYEGTQEAWIQLRATGADGVDVRYRAGVLGTPAGHWCGNPVTGAAEPCTALADYAGPSDFHDPSADPADTWWPMITVHGGTEVSIVYQCTRDGAWVACPPTFELHVRAVDGYGTPVGDLQRSA